MSVGPEFNRRADWFSVQLRWRRAGARRLADRDESIRLKNTLLFGGILLAINFFALAVFRNYIVVIIGNLAGGIGNTFILTGSQTLVQLFSPKEDIGKIISLRYTVHGLFSLIASFLGGIALSRVGSVPLLIFLGILAAGISLLSVGMDGIGHDAVAADF